MKTYDSIYDEFSWTRPATFNFATDVVDRFATESPQQNALHWIDDSGQQEILTFSEISRRSRQAASALYAAGVRPGDAILLVVGRQIAWWEVMTACLRGGFVAAPGTTQLSAKDIALRIKVAAAAAIVADAVTADKFDSIADGCPSLRAKIVIGAEREGWLSYEEALASASEEFTDAATKLDDPSICFFTSGTTGLPKLVVHSHGYGLAHGVTGKYWLDVTPADLHWNISDTGWAKAAWSSYFGPWSQGAAVFVHNSANFDPARTLEILNHYPITTICCAPTAYRMLVQQDLSSYNSTALRNCVSAGEPLNAEVINIWRKMTGVTIRDGYGQTESVILCASFPGMEAKAGSMGRPAPGIILAVLDGDGGELPPNEEGDLAVSIEPERPLGLFAGYGTPDSLDKSNFRGSWYITGDRAYRDEDGYFWFVGRADDVIISAGYRIGPFEVESALIEHDAVAESAVVSSPDPTRGEVVKAFVVLKPAYEPSDKLIEELQKHVKAVTAPYKYPRKIEFVSELPKTVSGKIRRVDLRKREWQEARGSYRA